MSDCRPSSNPFSKSGSCLWALGVVLILHSFPARAGEDEAGRALERRERSELARSGALVRESTPVSRGSSADLLDALDVEPALVLQSNLQAAEGAAAVVANLGWIQPRRGDSMVVLSNGVALSPEAEPGTDFSPIGLLEDASALTFRLSVPEGPTTVSFDYMFLSAEYPEYLGREYDDTFTATITDASGRRVIERASVNRADLLPASDDQVGFTGFALYTEDPDGVDRAFEGGMPDAGFTRFQRVSERVQSDGEIRVEFVIEDIFDGIMDSTVLLDNFAVSTLEAVDPNPDLLRNGRVVDDEETLVTEGRLIEAVAADGVTRLVLRNRVAGPGSVTFSLDGQAPEDGGLSDRDSGERLRSITVPVVETDAGFFAICIYRAPDEFSRGIDVNRSEREIVVTARFQPNQGAPVESRLELRLIRPPLLFVHGLWSGPETWQFPLFFDPRVERWPVDYAETNASRFARNEWWPGTELFRRLRAMRRDRRVAVTQADAIGHSMGGLLSRPVDDAALVPAQRQLQSGRLP